ncbi:unnamed protein product [Arabidopsis halleri]
MLNKYFVVDNSRNLIWSQSNFYRRDISRHVHNLKKKKKRHVHNKYRKMIFNST